MNWRGLGPSMALGMMALILVSSVAGAPQPTCQKIVMIGAVSAGQEWKTPIGQGWVFRVLPIDAAKTAPGLDPYSGWDVVVDREQPAGFPDALLLATPPYDSISEREVGTTFGVRAQDAIGWNPRSFRFLNDLADFQESRQLYEQVVVRGRPGSVSNANASERLMQLVRRSCTGQFRILDARLTPGIADAALFAENWALQSAQTPHAFDPPAGGRSTPLGKLDWMRFSVTLWLPGTWRVPAALHAARGACSE